jgi:hypothetical protein
MTRKERYVTATTTTKQNVKTIAIHFVQQSESPR